MIGHNSSPTVKSNNTRQEYKTCAGKFCSSTATNQLRILYINKRLWFCDKCKDDLIDLQLVLTEDINTESPKNR